MRACTGRWVRREGTGRESRIAAGWAGRDKGARSGTWGRWFVVRIVGVDLSHALELDHLRGSLRGAEGDLGGDRAVSPKAVEDGADGGVAPQQLAKAREQRLAPVDDDEHRAQGEQDAGDAHGNRADPVRGGALDGRAVELELRADVHRNGVVEGTEGAAGTSAVIARPVILTSRLERGKLGESAPLPCADPLRAGFRRLVYGPRDVPGIVGAQHGGLRLSGVRVRQGVCRSG